MILWENDQVRVRALFDLPTARGGYKRRRSTVSGVVVHQSAGNRLVGEAAPRRIAAFHTAPEPRGRGWPGCGYHYVVPGIPEVEQGRYVVFQANAPDLHTFHTGPRWNEDTIGVVVAGTYATRWAPHLEVDDLDASAFLCARVLVEEYLLPRFGLRPTALTLFGHFDAGKPTCPGDALEAWVRRARGEAFTLAKGDGRVEFRSVRAQQEALTKIGYDPGPIDGLWGHRTRAAVEAFQRAERQVVDGVWGPITDSLARARLASSTKSPT